MKDMGRSEIRDMIDHLAAEGYLAQDPEHQGLSVTAAASDVVYREKRVSMLRLKEEEILPVSGAKKKAAEDPELFEVLRAVRSELAKKAGVPPYIIFSNASLSDMAAKKPRTTMEFKNVSGVGELKAGWYAKPFLHAIKEYLGSTE